MNKITIDASRGILFLNDVPIAPLSIVQLRHNLLLAKATAEEILPSIDYITFGLDGSIKGEEFGVNITYQKNALVSVWLAWDGGIVQKKGYETSERELIADKNRLTKFMSRLLGKEPESRFYNHDVFSYEWGSISVAASLNSTLVTAGISWKESEK